MTKAAPTFDDVRAAARLISGAVENTPFLHSRTLSQIAGADVWIKFENLQFTASFKERGAANRLMTLAPDEAKRGLIAMSAGNHAQAVAYHAQRLGLASAWTIDRQPCVLPNRAAIGLLA